MQKNQDEIMNGEDAGRRILLAEGSFQNAGYYTVPVSDKSTKAVELHKGERFAVTVKITTPNTVHPAAIEYDAGDGRTFADLSDGEGYISIDGVTWERVEEKQNCNLCLKAYTKDR